MLHGRERQASEKIDDLQKIVKDYEYKVEILQNRLRKISDDVSNLNVFSRTRENHQQYIGMDSPTVVFDS